MGVLDHCQDCGLPNPTVWSLPSYHCIHCWCCNHSISSVRQLFIYYKPLSTNLATKPHDFHIEYPNHDGVRDRDLEEFLKFFQWLDQHKMVCMLVVMVVAVVVLVVVVTFIMCIADD